MFVQMTHITNLGIKQHYRSDTMLELKLMVFMLNINCKTNFQIFHIHKSTIIILAVLIDWLLFCSVGLWTRVIKLYSWMIDCFGFYAVAAIFQKCNDGQLSSEYNIHKINLYNISCISLYRVWKFWLFYYMNNIILLIKKIGC